MVFAPSARIGVQGMGTTLIEVSIPGEGQFARGVHIAKEHRGDGLASLRANKPRLYNSRHFVEPGQGSTIARDIHIDQTGIHFQDGLDHLVLGVWQIVRQTVVTLAVLMATLVQTSDKDHHISLLGLGHSLSSELSLRTGLIERAAYRHTIVTLDRIANITTSVVTLNIEL